MSLLKDWNPSWNVGMVDIDADHQRLFQLIQALNDSFTGGVASSLMVNTVDELIKYTKYHFEKEELLLEQIGNVKLDEHKKIHYELLQKILEYGEWLMEPGADRNSARVHFIVFLQAWLIRHILEMDTPAFQGSTL